MRHVLALLLLLSLARPVAAQPVEVDLELVLMVDASRSMSRREMEIQRRGYADALRSPAVAEAISGGLLGRVAVTYVEWAGTQTQNVIVDWRLLESAEDAAAFAEALTIGEMRALRRTSISGALDYGARSLAGNGFAGLRRVIDVSGDGPNNVGRPVLDAREAVLGQGIIINGLPLMTADGLGSRWQLEDLDLYYEYCVIGGPGAFSVPVTSWDDFAEAVHRKLVLELVGAVPRLIPAQHSGIMGEGYDCRVGEKIWERNMDSNGFP